jgi:hypothetical protein
VVSYRCRLRAATSRNVLTSADEPRRGDRKRPTGW